MYGSRILVSIVHPSDVAEVGMIAIFIEITEKSPGFLVLHDDEFRVAFFDDPLSQLDVFDYKSGRGGGENMLLEKTLIFLAERKEVPIGRCVSQINVFVA